MAQNKTMAIKHAMAKKWAIKEMTEDANLASCATKCVKQSNSTIWNSHYIPYSVTPREKVSC